jgi:hypothetical protein
MQGQLTIAALLAIWNTAKSDPDWNALEARVSALIDSYFQAADLHRPDVVMQILDILEQEAPAIEALVDQERQRLQDEQGHQQRNTPAELLQHNLEALWHSITTGNFTNATGVAVGPNARATVENHYHEPRYTRYTDISCPQRIYIAERLTMTVALMLQPQPESIVQQVVESFAGKVKVRLTAPDFAYLSSAEQTIVIEPDEENLPVVFYLKPYRLGNCEIVVEFRQHERSIASVIVPVEVIDTQAIFEAVRIPSVPINLLKGDA